MFISRISHALLLFEISLLLASVSGSRALRRQPARLDRRGFPGTLRNQQRTITIVTDTLSEDALAVDQDIIYPAHSFVVFGATDEECPLRVELVSPTVDGDSFGLAISVIELLNEREDIGDPQFPLPKDVSRSMVLLSRTTQLRNADIFNPLLDSSFDTMPADDHPHPVLEVAYGTHMRRPDSQLNPSGPDSLGTLSSHRFVEVLLCRPEFGHYTGDSLRQIWGTNPQVPGTNAFARFNGERWASAQRLSKLVKERPASEFFRRYPADSLEVLRVKQLMAAETPIEYIFFEARTSQPRSLNAPRRSSLATLFQLSPFVRAGRRIYWTWRTDRPWMGLIKIFVPSTFSRAKSVLILNRDPRLTSGNLLPDAHRKLIVRPDAMLPPVAVALAPPTPVPGIDLFDRPEFNIFDLPNFNMP